MIRILYVDDEADLRELGKLFLEMSGDIKVATVGSAREATAMLLEPDYDAVISDYLMPGMDGISFLKHLRAEGNGIPFVLFTGRGREEVVIEALNSGADFYLQKGGEPVAQFKELEHKIKEAVRRSRAEKALRENEQRLSMAQTISLTGCWEVLTGAQERQVWGSEEAFRMFGLKRPEDGRVELEAVESCIIERDMAHHALLDLIEKSAPYNIEYEIAPADGGHHRSIRSVAEVVPVEEGRSHKIVGIIQDITNGRMTEEALRRDQKRNEALLELSQLTDLTINEIAEKAMNYGLSLSHSRIGHIAFLNEDGTVLKMHHYSKGVMDNCKMKDRTMGFDLLSTGLWTGAVRQRRPVITNDYEGPDPLKKGLPEGHVRLKRYISIPVFDHNQVVAIAGMGNKETDYTMEDALDSVPSHGRDMADH